VLQTGVRHLGETELERVKAAQPLQTGARDVGECQIEPLQTLELFEVLEVGVRDFWFAELDLEARPARERLILGHLAAQLEDRIHGPFLPARLRLAAPGKAYCQRQQQDHEAHHGLVSKTARAAWPACPSDAVTFRHVDSTGSRGEPQGPGKSGACGTEAMASENALEAAR